MVTVRRVDFARVEVQKLQGVGDVGQRLLVQDLVLPLGQCPVDPFGQLAPQIDLRVQRPDVFLERVRA